MNQSVSLKYGAWNQWKCHRFVKDVSSTLRNTRRFLLLSLSSLFNGIRKKMDGRAERGRGSEDEVTMKAREFTAGPDQMLMTEHRLRH